ncbi:IS1 family transposase, partial [candidate division KSB1 bacterium]|nr:IS1 family transposase [candidate division KSB1 bacterium]
MEEETGEFWIWVSFVPEHRLVLATHVGHHEEKDAEAVVEKSKERLEHPLPLFVSDGWDAYIEALLGAFHKIQDRPRTGRPGRPPGPQMIPDPKLRYAQLVKVRNKGRVVATHKKVVFGKEDTIDMDTVSTSLIERENLSFRQDNRRLSRKTNGFSKSVEMLNH